MLQKYAVNTINFIHESHKTHTPMSDFQRLNVAVRAVYVLK